MRWFIIFRTWHKRVLCISVLKYPTVLLLFCCYERVTTELATLLVYHPNTRTVLLMSTLLRSRGLYQISGRDDEEAQNHEDTRVKTAREFLSEVRHRSEKMLWEKSTQQQYYCCCISTAVRKEMDLIHRVVDKGQNSIPGWTLLYVHAGQAEGDTKH